MKLRAGAIVPAGWAAYNGLLLAVLAGFGGNDTAMWVYAGAVALVEAFAAAVVFSRWRHPTIPRQVRLPIRGEASIFGGLGAALAGLGVVFGSWFYPVAAVVLAVAVYLAVTGLKNRPQPES